MSNPNYEKVGLNEDKLIEECSELIHIICKAKRFGLTKYHPQYIQNNRELILLEMQDVEKAINNYRKEIDWNPTSDAGTKGINGT